MSNDRGAPSTHRARAFRAAGRHSKRVALLRRAIIGGALVGLVSISAVVFFNPFGPSVPKISIVGSNLDGTRVTMEQPRLSGFRRDGRPYEVVATAGVQDVRQPNLIELSELNARIGMADQSTVQVTAATALYDSLRELMDFKSAVRMKSASYDIDMKSAKMDFKAGTVITHEAVKVVLSAGEIHAERMDIIDSGQRINFEGNVRSTFESSEHEPAASKGRTE